MSSDGKKRNWFAICFSWLILISIFALAYYYLIHPYFADKLERSTGSTSQYTSTIVMFADSYNGYAGFRTQEFENWQKDRGVKFIINDDNADYLARGKALLDEDIQMAVYTVDSYIKVCSMLKKFPGTMVMITDESVGADGFVVFEEAIKELKELNRPNTILEMTLNSPTEYFARVIMSQLMINISENNWKGRDGSEDVLKVMKKANRSDKRVYGLWEPELSQALNIPGTKELINSSKLQGHIIGILVVGRRYLADHPDRVRGVIEDYQRTLYSYQSQDRMKDLVKNDARQFGKNLSDKQVDRIVKGIKWRNMLENYAHFGLLDRQETHGLENIEDIIINVSKVLKVTGAIPDNPTKGKEYTLFYNQILIDMKNDNFHPGRVINVLSDEQSLGLDLNLDAIQARKELSPLSDEQWDKLVPVAVMRTKKINFGRGKAFITIQGQRDLKELAKNLQAWPDYYLLVIGKTNSRGDQDANRILASQRASNVVEYLLADGVDENRIKGKTAPPNKRGNSSSTVEFILGQKPY